MSLLAFVALSAERGCKWSTSQFKSGCLTTVMEETITTGLGCAFAIDDSMTKAEKKEACEADSCVFITDPAVMCTTTQFEKFAQSKEGRDGFMCANLKTEEKCKGNGACTYLKAYEKDISIDACQSLQMGSDITFCAKYTEEDKCDSANPPEVDPSAAPATTAALLLGSVLAFVAINF